MIRTTARNLFAFLPKMPAAGSASQSPSRINVRSARELRREGFHAEAARGFVTDGTSGHRMAVDDAVWLALCELELDAVR